MAWHKWFVRGLVFTIGAGVVLGTLAYQHWTNPAAVRTQVLAKMMAMFPGATISLEAASLRILGGIQVHELHIARLDDPATEVAQIPSAILYHNKEKMLEGELSFRKIELHRPRLRVVRQADGKWNVQGLSAPGKAGQLVPTIVVHQATIQFEDHSHAGGTPLTLELTQANLTLINDPLDVVTIDGAAQSDLLGKIELHGAWQRQANELALAVKTTGTCLNHTLLERIACLLPADKLKDMHLKGQADIQVNLALRSAHDPACTFSVRCQVSKTTVHHPDMPFPLENLAASIHYDGSELRLESLQAQSGATVVTARGVGRLPGIDQDFEGSVRLEHVDVNENLGKRLPEKLQPIMRLYQPRGRVTLQIDLARRDGQWSALASGGPSRVTIHPEGVNVCFERFPYPLQKVTGAIQCVLPQQRVTADLLGYAGTRPVVIKGRWQGEDPRIDMQYDVSATDVPIDRTLYAALAVLPEPLRKTVQAFHLTGKVDIQAQVRRQPADANFHGEYHLRVHEATALWDEFPYPMTSVSGLLDIYPTHWEARGFQGTHADGQVIVHARSAAADDRHAKPGVIVEITGKNLPFDADLHTAVRTMPPLARAWQTFQPSGRLNVTAAIDRRGLAPDDLDVRVDVKGPSIQPGFFRYLLDDVAGHFHLHEQRLEVRRFSAVHGASRWYFDKSNVELHPGGAMYAAVPELQVDNLVLDHDLSAALPPRLRDAVAALDCRDALRLKTQLVVSHSGAADALPDVYWDGQAWLHDAALTVGMDFKRVTGTIACLGRHNGRQLMGLQGNLVLERVAVFNQPFRNVHGRFFVKENRPELLLLDLEAPIFGGDITGQVSLDFQEVPKYELNLTASRIDLHELGKYNLGADSKLSGFAVARLYLTGLGSDPGTLDGHGAIDVPNGKLLNLPFLLDLIKFLGLRWPDRTMFEELHAQYAIRRRRAIVNHLELFGNAVSFTGKGEINLDGTDLHLELYPSWARMEQLLPPAVRSLPPTLSKNLLTVEANGKVTGNSKDIKFTKKPVPLLVDPLLQMRDQLIGPQSPEMRRSPETQPRQPMLPRLQP